MIQPAAPSALSALLPECAASAEAVESVELTPEFAALLALRLAGAGAENALADGGAPVSQQPAGEAPHNTGGKSLPCEVPLVVTEESAREDLAPDAAQLPETAAPTPPLAVLPIPLPAPPAEATAARQDAPAKARPMEPPVRPTPQAAAKPEQASVAAPALPRFSLPAGEEPPRRARIELPRVQAAESALLPQPAIAAAEAPATPVSATPVSAPLRPQAPHDFAALVDRLVEARDTAISARAPQAVSASITHAEFGNVSIRFETGGDALAVALSNADPEFARAVQAAAPATQANMASDNSAQPQGQRQDAAGQQASGSSAHSHQSPPQQRAAGPGARTAPAQTSGGEPQSGRTGIFA